MSGPAQVDERDRRGLEDPRRLRVHRPPAERDVPFVPTDDAVVPAILRLASVGSGDVLYDLGCGDGRIVIAAARQLSASGVGVDIDPLRIQECREAARRARVGDRVRFVQASLFDVDLRPATVVTLYLLPSLNIRLRPKLLTELRPGARVISNHFDMADWRPDEVAHAHHRTLYRWIVPAWVAGEWHCTINDPAGRRRIVLNLERRYQIVTGTALVGGRPALIGEGRIHGDMLTFRLVEWGRGGAIMRYRAHVEGSQLRGACWEDGDDAHPVEWGGVRAQATSIAPRDPSPA
ncbi:MAG TPA: class I SAM-dependent methyltransferase [Tepidisphaeraceae bacterium]|jgi:SAM-dependent methyltransferase